MDTQLPIIDGKVRRCPPEGEGRALGRGLISSWATLYRTENFSIDVRRALTHDCVRHHDSGTDACPGHDLRPVVDRRGRCL